MTHHELRAVAPSAIVASAKAHREACLTCDLASVICTEQCRQQLEATTNGE